jgi:Spy/CpxP family protein refolding chaperone
MSPEQLEKMQVFQETMTQLRNAGDQNLGKILDKGQVARLKQVQLQLQGPWVVLRDEMIEKLNITEEQVVQLREIRNGQREKQREVQKTGRAAFDAVMKQANPNFVGFGGGRGNRGNGGNNGGRNNGGGGNNGGGNNGGGNNGGGNNGGGNNGGGQNGNQGNRPPLDEAARQKFRDQMKVAMDQPEVKEQREKQRAQEKAVDDQSYALVSKALYPRQRATLKKMVGAPFDRSVMGGPFGGPAGDGGATAKTAAKTATTNGKAAVKKNSDDEDEEAAAVVAPAKKPAVAKPSATAPKRKSLRELRGASSDDE